MTGQVLPFELKGGMSAESMSRAIQGNFDHLMGLINEFDGTIEDLATDNITSDDVEDVATSAAGDVTYLEGLRGLGGTDGAVPVGQVTPTVVSGPTGVLFILWDTLENFSPVKYKVHVSTTTGFTPAANTLVSTIERVGRSGFKSQYTLRQFPVGHLLTDVPLDGTTYFVKIVPSDADGDTAGTYPQASGTPGGGSSVGVFVAETIVGDYIAGGTVTADKMSVKALSAITADLGTVTAGSITGLTITGGIIQTNPATSVGFRIALQDSFRDTIKFLQWTGTVENTWAQIKATTAFFSILGHGLAGPSTTPSHIEIIPGTDRDLFITTTGVGKTTITGGISGLGTANWETSGAQGIGIGTVDNVDALDNALFFRKTGGNTPAPPLGQAALYYDALTGTNGAIRAVKDGSRVTVVLF